MAEKPRCDECPSELGKSFLMVRQQDPSNWKNLCLACARRHRFEQFDASFGGTRWVGLQSRPAGGLVTDKETYDRQNCASSSST